MRCLFALLSNIIESSEKIFYLFPFPEEKKEEASESIKNESKRKSNGYIKLTLFILSWKLGLKI